MSGSTQALPESSSVQLHYPWPEYQSDPTSSHELLNQLDNLRPSTSTSETQESTSELVSDYTYTETSGNDCVQIREKTYIHSPLFDRHLGPSLSRRRRGIIRRKLWSCSSAPYHQSLYMGYSPSYSRISVSLSQTYRPTQGIEYGPEPSTAQNGDSQTATNEYSRPDARYTPLSGLPFLPPLGPPEPSPCGEPPNSQPLPPMGYPPTAPTFTDPLYYHPYAGQHSYLGYYPPTSGVTDAYTQAPGTSTTYPTPYPYDPVTGANDRYNEYLAQQVSGIPPTFEERLKIRQGFTEQGQQAIECIVRQVWYL
ncbi:hypothetical protein QCA50_018281 [Cerrena zonata]|uniref:Uncharacterized protein n=1 Tax=Cerrena zonata TaxID=2478898 RepID=A0AAW0FKI9_9APHY